jgi:hypothetical protein
MAQQVEERSLHLKTLKQSSADCEGISSTPTANTGPANPWLTPLPSTPIDPFRGPERRRVVRYYCEGSAEIRRDGTDLQIRARFTDMSLQGCYLESEVAFPVGAILHVKLEANCTLVENKGCVRVSYPHGMGLSFVEVTEEARGLLQQMLDRVTRPSLIAGPEIASSSPVLVPTANLPAIANPTAAVLALFEFFEKRLTLSREDFRRILHKSQDAHPKK